jgi:hypothetical protein
VISLEVMLPDINEFFYKVILFQGVASSRRKNKKMVRSVTGIRIYNITGNFRAR